MDINKKTIENFSEWADSLINSISAPFTTMAKVMTIYMDFNDARECVHIVYEKRGYMSACDFIDMLNNFELIDLDDRIKLKEYINVFEELKIKQKREKKLAQKIRNKLKK